MSGKERRTGNKGKNPVSSGKPGGPRPENVSPSETRQGEMHHAKKRPGTTAGSLQAAEAGRWASLAATASSIVFIVVCVMVFFGAKIVPRGGAFIAGIDVKMYFYWFESFIKSTILSGHLPLWNPHFYCGHPFLANPQTFVFHPATLLYVLLPLPWAFNLDAIIHVLIACTGSYALVRHLTANRAAGLFSAVCFGFSGYFMEKLHAGHLTMIHTAALIPWILLLIEKSISSGRRAYHIAAACVLGLQILGGEPQNSFYTFFFMALYYAVRVVTSRQGLSGRDLFRAGSAFAAIVAAAFCLAAVQVLPTLEFFRLCDRAERSYTFATGFSFPPQCLFTLLVARPQLTPLQWGDEKIPFDRLILDWELAGYLGIAAIVLAVAGIVLWRGGRQKKALVTTMAVALIVMLGHYTPLYRLFYALVPGFAMFRIPSRAVIFLVVPLVVLAGVGAAIIQDMSRKRACLGVVSCTTASLALVLAAGSAFFSIPIFSRQVITAFVFLGATFALCLVVMTGRRRPFAYGFALLALVDLSLAYAARVPQVHEQELLAPNEVERFIARDPESAPYAFRVAYPADLSVEYSPLRGIVKGYQNLNGYNPIVLRDFYRFVHAMAGVPIMTVTRHTLALGVFVGDNAFSSRILGVKYALSLSGAEEYVARVAKTHLPRAFIVSEAMFTADRDAQLGILKDPAFEPERTVVMEEKDRPRVRLKVGAPVTGDGGPAKVSITRYEPNQVVMSASSPVDAILVVSELFYPGWKAYVDGKEAPVLRADHILRAVALPSGSHTVRMVYRPLSFYAGLAISLATLGVLAALSLRRLVKKRGFGGAPV